jgi:hypothetical protein
MKNNRTVIQTTRQGNTLNLLFESRVNGQPHDAEKHRKADDGVTHFFLCFEHALNAHAPLANTGV